MAGTTIIAIIVGWIAFLGIVIWCGWKRASYLDAHNLRDDNDWWDL